MSIRHCAFALVCLGLGEFACAEEANLLENKDIRESGGYTYYALGDSGRNDVVPFTVAFYPGGSSLSPHCGLHANDAGGLNLRDGVFEQNEQGDGVPARKIPFSMGELTDGIASSADSADPGAYVSGWINVLSREEVNDAGWNTGQFDIVFDLGRICEVSKVEVWYASIGEDQMWVGTQELYAARNCLDGQNLAEGDLTLVSTGDFPESPQGEIVQTFAFDAKPFEARFLDLRLRTRVSRTPVGGCGANGGLLREIKIYGKTLK